MRWLAVFSLLLATVLPLAAENWTTVDGKTYKNVTVVQVEDDGVSISYTGGTTKLPYYNLPVTIQKRFGQDPESLAAAKKTADDEAAAAQAAALAAKKQQEARQKQQQDDAAQARALEAARAAAHLSTNTVRGTSSASPQSTFTGAEYSYNKVQDICYLDSPPANASPLPAPPVPDPMGHSSLTLRVETNGPEPEHADKIVATFLSVSTTKKLTDNHDVVFLVDGTPLPIGAAQKKDSDFVPGFGQVVEYVSFYLTPAQAHTIVSGKSVKFCVGSNNYTLEPSGIVKLQKYLAVLDQLPPPSSSFSRRFHNFIRGLPSLSSLISQTCVDVVLSGFGVTVFLVLCACFIGASRFFKM